MTGVKLLPHQEPPTGDWHTWVLLGGRGAGKTFAAVEWIKAVPGESTVVVLPNHNFGLFIRPLFKEHDAGRLVITYPARGSDHVRGLAPARVWYEEPLFLNGRQHEHGLFGEPFLTHRSRVLITQWDVPGKTKWFRELMKRPTTVVTEATTRNPNLLRRES